MCPERDSNSYTFRRHPLKVVRLPISPPGQINVINSICNLLLVLKSGNNC